MFQKLTAPTLKQLFVQELEGMILSGELAIGQKLPSERELAQKMQISRSVVNDGIAEMARRGFLEISPRQGTVVADFHRNGTLDILVSIMSYNGKVHFGLIGDAKLIPDPDAIIQRFRPEFEKLLYVALMARWEDTIYAEDAEAMMIDAR